MAFIFIYLNPEWMIATPYFNISSLRYPALLLMVMQNIKNYG